MAIGEIVLGSFLASFFQVLFDKLTSLALSSVQREGISTTPLVEWKEILVTINAVLADAEDRQLDGNHLVKMWLDDVKDLAYDMEDLLDELAVEAAQVKPEAESTTSVGWVRWKFSCFGRDTSSGSNPIPPSLVFETKVQEINSRLEAIVTRKAHLSLRKNVADRSDYDKKRDPTSSLPEPRFFGREKEEAHLLKLLISEVESSDAMLSIVPIVGMGGVGKTALAQQLYNDAKVKNYFERRVWVCVSDVFDVLDITKTILRSITGLSCEGEDLDGLQVKLKDSLSGKKFLVVLDDVWNEDYGKWTDFFKPFEEGAKASKIIITTRNLSVVSIRGASPYRLEELSLDSCTSLLAFHALGAPNFESHQYVEAVGKKLAEKCKGLPLAAKMLGGALCNERNLDKWEAMLNNRIWDLPKGKKDKVLPVLKLSYVHLPSYLKRCFAYCAIFPKDYEIERDELVLLWIAEGFLDGQKTKEDILRLGRDHFDELVSRSFLQQSRVDSSKFSMHDLLNDLANSIVGGTCYSSGESLPIGNEDDASLEKARHASFISMLFLTSKGLKAYEGMKVLRSLMLLHDRFSWKDKFHISSEVLRNLLIKMKYLRVFSICHCSIIEVPNCVGNLKHLRYLNFSYTDIKRLPESIVSLCKLQALILRGCRKLSSLPLGIIKMVNLQFLDIRDTKSLKEMPLGIGNLKNLIILSKFLVGSQKGSQIKELKDLSHLQEELFISELQKVEEVRDAVDANLIGKGGINKLFLNWGDNFGNIRNAEREVLVLHYLQPHTNLESLTISDYGGAIFSSWLGNPSYSKMVYMCLRGCPKVTVLPSLGQLPSLGELALEGLNAVSMIGPEFYGGKRPFSSLTTLKFEEMSEWKDWDARGAEEEVPFPYLEHLVIRRCLSLVGTLPRQLDRLTKLEIRSCPHLSNSNSMICVPSLNELYLEDCNEGILKSFVNLTSLTILKVSNVAELISFDHGCMSCLVKLKEFHIGQCDKLTHLWQNGNETQNLACLQSLVINDCPQFTSFVAEEGEIELPCNLERMELRNCTSLEKLPSKMHTLRHLSIWNCPKLIGLTIPPDDPSSNNAISQLEYLKLDECDSLTSFSFAKGRVPGLKSLYISGCNGVESLEEISIESLNTLGIASCKNLGSLPQCLHTLSHLTHLEIFNCPALEMEDFPPLPSTLSLLSLMECPKIKSVPNQWHHLTFLQDLYISDCRSIKCFPEGGLPPNLRRFIIIGCENLEQPVREWGLNLLTSLYHLSIDLSIGGEGEKVWFPSEEEDAWSLLFPSSLSSLWIYNMRDVERLSCGFCTHFSSLKWLCFFICPKLRYLPVDGLPSSLQVLAIEGCGNLKDGCSKLTGRYWSVIKDIPLIDIDRVRIQ